MIDSQSIKWDAHACPSFSLNSDLSFLSRYKNAGLDFVSLNVGFSLTAQQHTIALIKHFSDWLHKYSKDYALVKNISQVVKNKREGKLSIAFDIEGSELLNGELDMVDQFYQLGVRQMTFSYNKNNFSGGGCFDKFARLTPFGESLVERCNKVGMVIDCSHVGYQTSLDIISLSNHPVIFSHSNPASIVMHPRNIFDEQVIACAKKGGVVGINGISIFLGNNATNSELIVEHIDYIANLVGSDYVGIGLDFVIASEEINNFVIDNPDIFPVEQKFNEIKIAQPEQFCEIGQLLESKDYFVNEVRNILGENFFRVAKQVWK